jgi:lysine 2,3-aminomutase
VLDIPGGHGKSPIGPDYLQQDRARGRYRIADYNGRQHAYPPA